MKNIFIIQHLHLLPDGEEDVKLIGAYSSHTEALAAVARLRTQPGFSDFPNVVRSTEGDEEQGFYIGEFQLDLDYWPDGYVTV
ncbi:MAG: hypothetical protein WAV95_07745 [Azonexus sp.]